jgi:hypothetical protein
VLGDLEPLNALDDPRPPDVDGRVAALGRFDAPAPEDGRVDGDAPPPTGLVAAPELRSNPRAWSRDTRDEPA